MKFKFSSLVLHAAALAAASSIPTLYGQATNPTQTNLPDAASSPYPVFRVTAVSRSIKAINYQHRQGSTVLAFEGTSLAPKAKGEGRIDSKTGATKIDINFEKLPLAQVHGPEFLTYVLWAVTPEGRFSNLGEVYIDDNRARLQTATDLQSFGLIVTAEPYFAVTQPSDVVVMENVVLSSETKGTTTGTMTPIDAKYELLQRGLYNSLLPTATRNLTKEDRKDSPLDLKEARHAVAIAATLGARQYATDTMAKADQDLKNAEDFWDSSKDKKKVQSLARNATQLAEDARIITVRKREEESREAERIRVEQTILVARTKANDEAANARLEAERRLKAEADSARANREAQAAQQSALADRQLAEQARAQAESAKLESERSRQSVLESQRQLEEQRRLAAEERTRLESEQTRIKAMAAEADRARLQAEADRARLREELRRQFNFILETRDTARGLVVNMADVLFDSGKHTLRPTAREKLAKVSGIVLAHPGLKLEVEGHTDSVGPDDFNQTLSEKRANSVRDFLVQQGLNSQSVTAKGFGESNPIAGNSTAADRQKNRRVEMVVSGEVIDKKISISADPTGQDK